ncbi:MAG: hypothetical protein NTY22_07665 [Proteobacteria bacterium]|nr:hypothetical protein [Pseudomonadota bacterium]
MENIKEVKENQVEVPSGRLEEYFFPDYRITIKATSLEEATKKLKDIKVAK